MDSAKVVYICLDVNPDNPDGEALFGYFRGTPTLVELRALQASDYRSAVTPTGHQKVVSIPACLSWTEVLIPAEMPNSLSMQSGLKRFLIGLVG